MNNVLGPLNHHEKNELHEYRTVKPLLESAKQIERIQELMVREWLHSLKRVYRNKNKCGQNLIEPLSRDGIVESDYVVYNQPIESI